MPGGCPVLCLPHSKILQLDISFMLKGGFFVVVRLAAGLRARTFPIDLSESRIAVFRFQDPLVCI